MPQKAPLVGKSSSKRRAARDAALAIVSGSPPAPDSAGTAGGGLGLFLEPGGRPRFFGAALDSEAPESAACRGHGHHGVGRPRRGNCGKIPSRFSSWSRGRAPRARGARGFEQPCALPRQRGRAAAHPAFPLFLRKPTHLSVEEKGKADAGSSNVHLVAVDVGEAEVQCAEGDGPPQLHQGARRPFGPS